MSNIYLQDRYKDPKQVFKTIYKIINNYNKDKNLKIIDFGGAEGAFAHFVINQQPNYEITNIEYDKKLLELSKKNVPLCKSIIGDINSCPKIKNNSYDIVTCIGVISIFDDFRPSINEMLRVVKKGGLIIINNMWNSYPIDLLIKVRHAKNGSQKKFNNWESGWNMISIKTISEFLKNKKKVKSFSFKKVIMKKDLLKNKNNLLRSWTNKYKNGERYHFNGIGRLLDKRLLIIQINK
tara:strand:- start:3161 stop:3871 length:711 start_codon:yes stop_codon:yes gene_type:complete